MKQLALGKLIKVTKETCPECEKGKIHLRYGTGKNADKSYLVCPYCGSSVPFRQVK